MRYAIPSSPPNRDLRWAMPQRGMASISRPEHLAAQFSTTEEGEAMRPMPLVIILPFLTSGLIMTANAAAPAAQDHASALLKLEREWNEALRTKNVAWFEQNLADDVTDMTIRARRSTSGSVSPMSMSIEMDAGWRALPSTLA